MKQSLFVCILAFVLGLLSPFEAWAQSFGLCNGTCTSACTSTHATFSAAHTAAVNGDTIFIFDGASVTITNHTITKNISVVGGGLTDCSGMVACGSSTVSPSGTARHFVIDVGKTVTMANLLLQGGDARSHTTPNGGSIFVSSAANLHLDDVSFDDNIARFGGAVYAYTNADVTVDSVCEAAATNNTAALVSSAGGQGGAFYAYVGATYDIEDYLFDANTAVYGGAMYLYGAGFLNMDDSTLTDNTAQGAGAIFSYDHSEITITDSTFDENHATAGSGGAIYVDTNDDGDSFLTVEGSTFQSCTATTSGGAIAARELPDVDLTAEFVANTSTTIGGAVVLVNVDDADLLACAFDGNVAGTHGGSLSVSDTAGTGDLSITDSTFVGSTASAGNGGAVQLNSLGDVVIDGSWFANNTAINAGGDSLGGAIQANDVTALTCTDDNTSLSDVFTFSGNEADLGGAVSVIGGTAATLMRVIAVENAAQEGSAFEVRDSGTSLLLRDALVIENTDSDGGSGSAVRAMGTSSMTIDGVTVAANADLGIDLDTSATGTVRNTIAWGNTGNGIGGAGTPTVTCSTLEGTGGHPDPALNVADYSATNTAVQNVTGCVPAGGQTDVFGTARSNPLDYGGYEW